MKLVRGSYSELILYGLFFMAWIMPETVYLDMGAVVVRPMDIAAVVIVFAGAAHQLSRGRFVIPRDRSLLIIAAFVLWAAASFIWAEHKSAVILQLIQWLEIVLIFVFMSAFLRTEEHLRQFILTLLVFATLLQFFLGIGSIPVLLGFKSYVRVRTDPFFSALLLTFLCAFLAERETPIRKPFMLMLIFISGCNLIFSINRKDIIGFAACLVLMIVLSSKRKGRLLRRILTVGCIALGIVTGVKTASPQLWEQLSLRFQTLTFQEEKLGSGIEGRITHMAISHSIFKHHPFVGVGLGNHHKQFRDYFVQIFPRVTAERTAGVHNGFLLILGELGAVGFVIFLLLLWRSFQLLSFYKKDSHRIRYPSLLLGSASLIPLVLLKFGTAHGGIGTFFPIFFLLILRGSYERIIFSSQTDTADLRQDRQNRRDQLPQAADTRPKTIVLKPDRSHLEPSTAEANL